MHVRLFFFVSQTGLRMMGEREYNGSMTGQRCVGVMLPFSWGQEGWMRMELTSQIMRRLAPELDPLRIGTGWKREDLVKPQIMIESTFGDSHPGSGHLDRLVEAARRGIAEEGGFGARYFCTDICDGESQGTDGINFSLASREMIAGMIEIHASATPFDAGVYIASCDKGIGCTESSIGEMENHNSPSNQNTIKEIAI